jgi:hypothetical protein
METMINIVGSLSESHALFINNQHVEWDISLLRLYYIHCASYGAVVGIISLAFVQGVCDVRLIVNNKHEHDPVGDFTQVKYCLTQGIRYEKICFKGLKIISLL